MRTTVLGHPVVENDHLHWREVVVVNHPTGRVFVCGEANHLKHMVWIEAWKEACREDLRRAAASLAERWGLQ